MSLPWWLRLRRCGVRRRHVVVCLHKVAVCLVPHSATGGAGLRRHSAWGVRISGLDSTAVGPCVGMLVGVCTWWWWGSPHHHHLSAARSLAAHTSPCRGWPVVASFRLADPRLLKLYFPEGGWEPCNTAYTCVLWRRSSEHWSCGSEPWLNSTQQRHVTEFLVTNATPATCWRCVHHAGALLSDW